MNPILIIAAILGFLSIAFGAAGDHLIGASASLDHFNNMRWFETALRYHQFSSVYLLALGLFLAARPSEQQHLSRWLTRAAWLGVAGAILFSGSLYAAALTSFYPLTYATPVGGLTMMASWLCLAYGALRRSA